MRYDVFECAIVRICKFGDKCRLHFLHSYSNWGDELKHLKSGMSFFYFDKLSLKA